MELGHFVELWFQTYIEPKKARNTVRAYRFAYAHLPQTIKDTEIDQLDPMVIQMAINQLESVYSRQAQLLYQVLRASLARAVKLRYLVRSPMDLVDPPKHTPKRAKVLSMAEAMAYAEAASDHPLLVLMLAMGLRRNEARGLRFGDYQDGILHVRAQRTTDGLADLKSASSRRDLPVPDELRAIFVGPPGNYIEDISETSLRRAHLRALRAIGVEGVTLHGLRHTCATLAAAEEVPLSTIQHLLGHRHVTLTADLYCHADLRPLARCTKIIYNCLAHTEMAHDWKSCNG